MRKRKKGISQNQKEKLTFIDFCANYLGSIGRSEVMKRFGISDVSASKCLSEYAELAPKNLKYDFKTKTHQATKHFKPLFGFDITQALKALSTGFGDTLEQLPTSFIESESSITLNKPKSVLVAQVTRAINLKRIVDLKYHSLSSGETERQIAPFALVDSGLRWHVRAYDRKRGEFRDFVFTRMLDAKLTDEARKANESLEHDDSWNQLITLELTPHPGNIAEKESIELDYGMVDGKVEVTLRKAVAGYVLRHWNVDCTENHELDGKHFQLWLRNKKSIDGIEGIILAPGIEREL
jgi:predicted DNA-binding transcriptional regulator YafY